MNTDPNAQIRKAIRQIAESVMKEMFDDDAARTFWNEGDPETRTGVGIDMSLSDEIIASDWDNIHPITQNAIKQYLKDMLFID